MSGSLATEPGASLLRMHKKQKIGEILPFETRLTNVSIRLLKMLSLALRADKNPA